WRRGSWTNTRSTRISGRPERRRGQAREAARDPGDGLRGHPDAGGARPGGPEDLHGLHHDRDLRRDLVGPFDLHLARQRRPAPDARSRRPDRDGDRHRYLRDRLRHTGRPRLAQTARDRLPNGLLRSGSEPGRGGFHEGDRRSDPEGYEATADRTSAISRGSWVSRVETLFVLARAHAAMKFPWLAKVEVRFCKQADATHKKKWRHFAHTNHDVYTVCFAKASEEDLTDEEILGI